MILFKNSMTAGKRERKSRTMQVHIDELPKRFTPKYSTPRDQEKYIKNVEAVCRKSMEYKAYIQFLRQNLDMNQCTVLKNVISKSGKHYRIEIHHEPFTLFDIVQTVIQKRLDLRESISELKVADEVMGLHYDGKVGLIPLTVTMHELVHNGRIFIPLQYVYQDYSGFYQEYQQYIEDNPILKDKIEAKVNLSMRTEDIVSDALNVEFVCLDVDGFQFPEIPPEWKNALSDNPGNLQESPEAESVSPATCDDITPRANLNYETA